MARFARHWIYLFGMLSLGRRPFVLVTASQDAYFGNIADMALCSAIGNLRPSTVSRRFRFAQHLASTTMPASHLLQPSRCAVHEGAFSPKADDSDPCWIPFGAASKRKPRCWAGFFGWFDATKRIVIVSPQGRNAAAAGSWHPAPTPVLQSPATVEICSTVLSEGP